MWSLELFPSASPETNGFFSLSPDGVTFPPVGYRAGQRHTRSYSIAASCSGSTQQRAGSKLDGLGCLAESETITLYYGIVQRRHVVMVGVVSMSAEGL
jgi:hypothetical protein